MVLSQQNVDHNDSPSEVQHRANHQREIILSRETNDVAMACELVLSHCSPLMHHSQSPNTPSRELPLIQSNQYTRSIIREMVRKDGYKWKKYGEKNIKKNEHKRSYYKCTHSNCQAKKKFHWSNDGTVEYFSDTNPHNHPNPQSSIVPPIDHALPIAEHGPHQPYLAGVEVQGDKYSLFASILVSILHEKPLNILYIVVHADNHTDATRAGVLTDEPHLVVQTSSANEVVNDAYRWCKYGRKMVNGKIIQRYILTFVLNSYIVDRFKMHFFYCFLSMCFKLLKIHKFMK